MKMISHFAVALGAFAALPVFAYQLRCVSDFRAVDGGLTEFTLKVDSSNSGSLSVHTAIASPLGTHDETSGLYSLACSFPRRTLMW